MPRVLLCLQKTSGVMSGTEGQILRFSRSKKSVDIVTRDGGGALCVDFRKHADAHTDWDRDFLFVPVNPCLPLAQQIALLNPCGVNR